MVFYFKWVVPNGECYVFWFHRAMPGAEVLEPFRLTVALVSPGDARC